MAILRASSTDPGIANLTCRPGVPVKPDVKLASSILSACSWYNFCNSAFSTFGTVRSAKLLHLSANSWGDSPFFCLAI
jgi:hypothetical protein